MHTSTNSKRTMKILWPCVLALFILSGCATTIKTNVLMPGNIDQAAQFKSIAVMPIEGPDGEAFTSVVESALASVIIDGQQFFQLVDRVSLDKVMNEMKLGITGMVNEDTAAQVGKVVGAKGIYTGTINTSSVQDDPYSEKRQKCAFYRTVTDGAGRTTQECTIWFDSQVSCTKRTASFSFTPKLIEVESGRTIFSSTYENAVEAKVCEDEGKGLEDGTAMQKKTQEAAMRKFRMDVAPYYVTMSFTLKDSTADITLGAAKAKLREGLAFAKANRMDQACPVWREAKALAPDSVTLMYNVGICDEIEDRPHEALALYRRIEKALTSPDDLITTAIARVNAQIENRKKLAGQVAR
jgi:hypothetical protein